MLQFNVANTGTPLAAMDRLGDATGKFNDDLRFHQFAVAWRDSAALWPRTE
jgi:hypothetical protein